jgi:UTP--glucose-1-phosphate uridylyltransferase
MNLEQAFAPFAGKMAAAGLDPIVVETFRQQYAKLQAGETGHIPGAVAQPVDGLHAYEELDTALADRSGTAALARTVVCKLNGGLGTGMGLDGPKSLLPVKDGLTFLDIAVRQVLHLRAQTDSRLPLLLMNSFSTRAASRAALARYDLDQDLPLDFVQNKVPKVARATGWSPPLGRRTRTRSGARPATAISTPRW